MSFRDEYFSYKQTDEFSRATESAARRAASSGGGGSGPLARLCCRLPWSLAYVGCASAVAALFTTAAIVERATVWLSIELEAANGEVTFLGRTAVVNSTLWSTLEVDWDSAAYITACARVCFAVVVPLTCVTCMTAAMVVQCCNASRRGHTARGCSLFGRAFLNLLPKWAAFGLVTSVIEALSYQYQLRLFEGPLLPQVNIDIEVAAADGSYLATFGLLGLLLLGHIPVVAGWPKIRADSSSAERAESVASLVSGGSCCFGMVAGALPMILLAGGAASVAGMFLPSGSLVFSSEIVGARSAVDNSTFALAPLGLEIWNGALRLPEEELNISELWSYRLLSVLFSAVSLLLPLLSLATAQVLWLLPMRPDGRRRGLLVLQLLGAWSATDVWVTAVAVASVDVQKYTPGTALQACGDLPEIPIIGPIVPDGVPCFATVAEVGTGWYLLLLGVTIQWCCSLFVAFCAHATLPYELEPKLDRGVRGRRESLQFGWDREGPASVLRRDRSEY